MTEELTEFRQSISRSILRGFTPTVFHASSYLVGSDLIPKEYGYNIEIETEMINGKLNVTGVNYWVDELPSEGYIERTENFKERVIFDINASDRYKPDGIKKKILNFIIGLLEPKLGYKEDEVVYERYLLGRRLYVYGENDIERKYYWYGTGNQIVSNIEFSLSRGLAPNSLSRGLAPNSLSRGLAPNSLSEGDELFVSDLSENEELNDLTCESIVVNNLNKENPH